jgi:predicted alpha/beta superfamily hydrolase
MKYILAIYFLSYSFGVLGHTNNLHSTFDLASEKTGDTYQIMVSLPISYNSAKKYPIIYYADAHLKSGILTRKVASKLMTNKKIKDCILVGIKHYGSYRTKRRRDFIQAHYKNKAGKWYSNDANYGQSLKFYQFLKLELLPKIEGKYKVVKGNRTFSGHSLSGLFAMYAMLQPQPIFKNHIALSPSIWANYQNLWSFERLYFKNNKTLNVRSFVAAGGLEIANLVLYNVNGYTNHLKRRNYKSFFIKKKIYNGKTHISAIENGIRDGLLFSLKK